MRLVILMGTQRSHFAYRLAWENSFAERIPFLPLHRRDLVSAEEGNKTFVGENKSRINWKKFEVMGEVVLGIQRSQKTAHPQAMRSEDLERLILDTKLSGDEEVGTLFPNQPTIALTDCRTCMPAVCKSNHLLVVNLHEESSAGYVLKFPRQFYPVTILAILLRFLTAFSRLDRQTRHTPSHVEMLR